MKNRLNVLLADDEDMIRRKVLMMLGDTFNFEEATSAVGCTASSRKGL